jgi:hypothetical protein
VIINTQFFLIGVIPGRKDSVKINAIKNDIKITTWFQKKLGNQCSAASAKDFLIPISVCL